MNPNLYTKENCERAIGILKVFTSPANFNETALHNAGLRGLSNLSETVAFFENMSNDVLNYLNASPVMQEPVSEELPHEDNS